MATRQECERRIDRLQKMLAEQELDGALLLYPIDIYYFAGTRQNAALWVPTSGTARLLVRKSLSRARRESCIEEVIPFPKSRELGDLLGEQNRRIGLTYDVLPVQQLNYYAKLLPDRTFSDISALNRELRSVKSDWELKQMETCADSLCAVFAQVPRFLHAGMREIDLAAEFEYRARKLGLEGFVRMRAFNQELFQGIAVSGPAAAEPGFFDGAVTGQGLSGAAAHGSSAAMIEPGVPIMVDYTGVLGGYIVDMTRIFVLGTLDQKARHAFDTALTIQRRIEERLTPGVSCAELFDEAQQAAVDAGLGECFMGIPGEQARFVGHGVGLELDEMPVLAKGFDQPLRAGQTVAVEPKFVMPGIGVVGIENTFVVDELGGRRLTDIPDALVEL